MKLRQIILSILTFVVLIPIFLSLFISFQEPQVQSDLQLYQTDIILQGSELDLEKFEIPIPRNTLLGKDSYEIAEKQYQKVQTEFTQNLERLKQKYTSETLTVERDKKIKKQERLLNQIILKKGIIQAANHQTAKAIKTWEMINPKISQTQNTLADALQTAWSQPTQLSEDKINLLDLKLLGWFRYQTLKQIYQARSNNAELATLESQEQILASKAITKLLIVSLIPFICGSIGIILLLFVLIQQLIKKDESLLSINQNKGWEVPWKFEITWQVLIVGFFLVSQILSQLFLPLILQGIGLNMAETNLRFKAIYVLISYVSMAIAGLSVLYLSIKNFLPLPQDWFKFNINFKNFLWGLGGYFVAVPLVVLVSLVNQQLWQGQGGSNPLLSLALESQDSLVLLIFFFTASLAAPFYEELMFRGFLLPALTRYVPLWGAIGISALIFAVAHLSLSEVLPLFTLGIVLGIVYTRSRNLFSSMLLHGLWNGGTLLSLFILGSSAN